MATTLGFHIILACLGIALPSIVLLAEYMACGAMRRRCGWPHWWSRVPIAALPSLCVPGEGYPGNAVPAGDPAQVACP
jgi:hypothetical protein